MTRTTTVFCVVALLCGFLLPAVRPEVGLGDDDLLAAALDVGAAADLLAPLDHLGAGFLPAVSRIASLALLGAGLALAVAAARRRRVDDGSLWTVGRRQVALLRAPPAVA